jgi:ribose transport system substrate-binding protein
VDITRLSRWREQIKGASSKYVVGFSQATTIEPWRVQFNVDIRAAAKNYPEIRLLISDAGDNAEKQVADVEYFINYRVDALLISPKEAARLTGVAVKAIDARIPLFVLDRNLNTRRYTSFVRGDNAGIGRKAGEYAIELLSTLRGSKDKNIFEIWGGLGTEASYDRSRGFREGMNKALEKANINAKILPGQYSADWKQIIAYEVMGRILRRNERIDLVYCHNDAMARGAYLAVEEVRRAGEIKFIGVDALPSQGIEWVREGWLAATFKYPTPGVEALQQVLNKFYDRKVEKDVILKAGEVITKDNVARLSNFCL